MRVGDGGSATESDYGKEFESSILNCDDRRRSCERPGVQVSGCCVVFVLLLCVALTDLYIL